MYELLMKVARMDLKSEKVCIEVYGKLIGTVTPPVFVYNDSCLSLKHQ